MSVNSVSGIGGAGGIPSAGEMQDYSNKLGKMDTQDLFKELGKNLEPWQRDMVAKELVDRAMGTNPSQGGGGPQVPEVRKAPAERRTAATKTRSRNCSRN